MTIAAKIKTYLKETGHSQSNLCKQTGLGQTSISLSLNNKRRLRLDEYCKICNALGVDLRFFL